MSGTCGGPHPKSKSRAMPEPLLLDLDSARGRGKQSASEGSLWEVATSLCTSLCGGVLGKVTSQERRPGKLHCHKNVVLMMLNGGKMRMKGE